MLNSALRWAVMLAGIGALWLTHGPLGAPYVANDGYQYLDAAANLVSGQCFCTGVAMFDEQVAYGRLPVPFTHFAPGYPLLVAGASLAGVKAETAGYLLSALGFLAVLWLIWDVGTNLGGRPWVVALFSLLWVAHAAALYYAAVVGTETIFAALMLAVAALIARDIRSSDSPRPALTTAIGILAGLSYWMRYPGLFLVAGAGVYLIVRAWRSPRSRRGALGGLLAAAVLVASIQIRNAIDTGSWRGAFNNPGTHTLAGVTADTARSFLHYVVGSRLPLRFDVWTPILALSFLAALLFVVQAWRHRRAQTQGAWVPLAWTVFIGLTYVGGVFAAAVSTIAGDLPRYYFPSYPLFLTCAAVLFSAAAVGFRSLAIVLFVASTLIVQGRDFSVPVAQPDWILTRSYLDEPEPQTGMPMIDWLRNRLMPGETLLAVEGQAVHYLIERPVIAVVPARDTARRKDDVGFHDLMRQRRTRYLLVFPGAPPDRVLEQTSYAFMNSLASGDAPPWLRLAARTRDAAVYECADCTALDHATP